VCAPPMRCMCAATASDSRMSDGLRLQTFCNYIYTVSIEFLRKVRATIRFPVTLHNAHGSRPRKRLKNRIIFTSVSHHETDQTVLAQTLSQILLRLIPITHEIMGQGVDCSLTGWPTARRPNWTARRVHSHLNIGLTKIVARLLSVRQST